MGKEYVPIFLDWLETTQDLTAQEKGNLIDAVVAYASGLDYEAMLTGNEKIAFRFLKGQIDRNSALSETRANARRGRQSEQNETNDNKTEQNETNENKTEETESNSTIENKKQKTKIENKKQKTNNSAFSAFWEAYPRHTNKQAALKAFAKIEPDAELLRVMLDAIARQQTCEQWTKDGGQFIPHPATWLNGRRWEDEIPQGSPPRAAVSAQAYEQRTYSAGKYSALADDALLEARRMKGA